MRPSLNGGRGPTGTGSHSRKPFFLGVRERIDGPARVGPDHRVAAARSALRTVIGRTSDRIDRPAVLRKMGEPPLSTSPHEGAGQGPAPSNTPTQEGGVTPPPNHPVPMRTRPLVGAAGSSSSDRPLWHRLSGVKDCVVPRFCCRRPRRPTTNRFAHLPPLAVANAILDPSIRRCGLLPSENERRLL